LSREELRQVEVTSRGRSAELSLRQASELLGRSYRKTPTDLSEVPATRRGSTATWQLRAALEPGPAGGVPGAGIGARGDTL